MMMFVVVMASLVESRPDLNLVFATEMRVAGGYGTVAIIREKRHVAARIFVVFCSFNESRCRVAYNEPLLDPCTAA